MQKIKLPLTLNPIHTTQKHLNYQNIYTPNQIKHITKSIININNNIKYSISFTINNQHLTILNNNTKITITLKYQHYKKPFTHQIYTTYYFNPIHSNKQTKTLPKAYKPIKINKFNKINLLTIIKNKIILTLPIIPIHNSKHYKISKTNIIFNKLPKKTQKPNPFTILTNLKHK